MQRNIILHVQRHPYYGAEENAFNTINKDLEDYSHVFVECCPPEYRDAFYLHSSSAISQRADMHVAYAGTRLEFHNVQAAIYYDLSKEEGDRYVSHDGKTIVWDFGSVDKYDVSVRDANPLYPMLDTDRISAITGKVTKPTVGVLFDPNVPGFNVDLIRLVADSLDENHRLIVTRPDCLYRDMGIEGMLAEPRKCEVISRPYVIGFDWQIESLCSIVVSDYTSTPGTYGYMCATAMAMGKVLICDKMGQYAKYSTDRVSAIHFDDWKTVPKYIDWVEKHPQKADKLRAAAMYHAYPQDKDPNLHRMRELILA